MKPLQPLAASAADIVAKTRSTKIVLLKQKRFEQPLHSSHFFSAFLLRFSSSVFLAHRVAHTDYRILVECTSNLTSSLPVAYWQ